MFFYINNKQKEGNLIKISGEDYHHIINVLRKKQNDKIKFTDGKFIYITEIVKITENYFYAQIIETNEKFYKNNIEIILLIGLIKFSNFEEILRWTTPLGVSAFIPILTKNSQKIKVTEERIERWKKIVKEVCNQSENIKIPEIYLPIFFEDSLKLFNEYFKIMLHPTAPKNLKDVLIKNKNKKILLYIGSEAGFNNNELEKALNNNIEIAKISENILRTEVASVVAVSNILFFYE